MGVSCLNHKEDLLPSTLENLLLQFKDNLKGDQGAIIILKSASSSVLNLVDVVHPPKKKKNPRLVEESGVRSSLLMLLAHL